MTNMNRLLCFHSQISSTSANSPSSYLPLSSIITTIFAMITTTMVMNMNWIFDPRTATTHEGRAAVFQEELCSLSSIIDIIFIIIFTMIIVVMIRILILSRRRRWAGRQLTGTWKILTGKAK